jgi:hypothetical protein
MRLAEQARLTESRLRNARLGFRSRC